MSAPPPPETPTNPALAAEARIARTAVTVFPLLVLVAGVVGYLTPSTFTPLAPSVPYLLGLIMFCMGLTLTPPDLASVAKRPWAVVLGIVARRQIAASGGRQTGDGVALTAVIIGAFIIVVWVAYWVAIALTDLRSPWGYL